MQIGFCGAGNMALALGRAMARELPDAAITAFDVSRERLDAFASALPRFAAAESNRQVAETSDVVFLAVKPQVIDDVLTEIADSAALIVSIAAGIPLSRLEAAVPQARLVRVMPNTPCLVGAMAAGYALGTRATDDDAKLVESLLSSAGEAILLDERQLDAVTGLSGSGPAFVARLVEAFVAGGVSAGLDHTTALRLTLATFSGTARLLAETGMSPEELVAMVSSPGGTTVAGRTILENSDVTQIIADTVERAAERSRELGS